MSAILAMLLLTSACETKNDDQCKMEQLKAELQSIRDSVPEKQKRDKRWPEELRTRAKAGRDKVTREWVVCTHLKALDYSKLPESADAVATAALAACSEWSNAYKVWSYVIFESEGLPLAGVNRAMARGQQEAKERLIAFVMDRRVRRTGEEAIGGGAANEAGHLDK